MGRRKSCPFCEQLAVGFIDHTEDYGLHQLSAQVYSNGHVLIESYVPAKGKRQSEELVIEADINFCPICGKKISERNTTK